MKNLLLTFLTPCGRIGESAFWWRQFLLAPLLFASTFAAEFGMMTMEGYAGQGKATLLPLLFAQASPLGLLAGIGGHWSAERAFWDTNTVAADMFPGFSPWPGLAVIGAAALALLFSWCSFALVLRRLRDNGSLKLLPLGLPLLWLLLHILFSRSCPGHSGWVEAVWIALLVMVFLSCLFSLILLLGPARGSKEGNTPS